MVDCLSICSNIHFDGRFEIKWMHTVWRRVSLTEVGYVWKFNWVAAEHYKPSYLRYSMKKRWMILIKESFKMKTSARNTLKGIVVTVIDGVVNSEVTLRLESGVTVYAIVTIESARLLGLVPGKTAYALIKSSWVILTSADEEIITSARNRLCGVVSRIEKGAVNTEVALDFGNDNTLVAIITNESQNLLNFSIGSAACALIKASHVILAVEE